MELLARRITERNGDYAEITGGRDIGRILRIPDEIEGLPVCSVAGHAFERNQMIEEVILPDSLLQVGGFAFYGCGKLRKISLSDHTEGWGNGVLRLCDSLSHVEFRVHRGRYAVLRDLLAPVFLKQLFRFYPEALRMEMKTEYERWLRENSEDVLRLLLGERSMEARERVFFLAGNGLLTPEAADAGALIASGMRDGELTALLMSCGTMGRAVGEEPDSDLFDLGDL